MNILPRGALAVEHPISEATWIYTKALLLVWKCKLTFSTGAGHIHYSENQFPMYLEISFIG